MRSTVFLFSYLCMSQMTASVAFFESCVESHGCKVRVDALCNGAAEVNGHRVSDEASKGLEAHFSVIRDKRVVARKALKNGGFPQRDRSVLFWVTKSAIAKAIALGRHRRSGL